MITTGTISSALEQHASAAARVRALFTPRETEIIQLIAGGLTTKEIEQRLGISHHTINNHREAIYRKSQARNIADLTRIAVKFGFIIVEVVT